MFSFKIAKRFLVSNKSQTLFIIIGIAIGISVQVFVGALIQGLQKGLIDDTIGSQPHITIISNTEEEEIEEWETIFQNINNLETVSTATTTIDTGAFVLSIENNEIKDPTPIVLRGFNLEEATQIYSYYDEETFIGEKPNNENETIIGIDFQNEYEIKIGDVIQIQQSPNPLEEIFNLTVVGTFDLGVASLNSLWMITNQDTVINLFDFGNNITSISIQIEDVFQSTIVTEEIMTQISDENIIVVDWQVENSNLLSALNGQSTSSMMIQVFIVVSVVISIASILAITVVQKSKQIGILKAMGVSNGTAARIFIFEGMLLGLLGGILGVIFGVGLLVMFTTFAVDSDGKSIVAISLDPIFLIFSGLIALISSMLSALIPAKRSSKLSIIEVIQNG